MSKRKKILVSLFVALIALAVALFFSREMIINMVTDKLSPLEAKE